MNARKKATIKATIAGGIASVILFLSYKAALHTYHMPAASTEATQLHLKPFNVNPAWIKSGTPNFRADEFFKSGDGQTSSGIFECDAATFEWHYQFDEAVYILDGSVTLDYQGKQFTLHAGESALFRAGTTAVWHVPDHIRKSWTIYDAGKPARGLAKLLQ
ncbi:cupin domain-containing protein [Undibacterium sp. RuRC25W]|uniref:cupin domain-containing protein n=1 Tax=Undibacterium sp. RuRC25W TaxID=3413047 RepID=UPI003BEFB73A